MLVVVGFQKFADIPFGISRIFGRLMPQQICTNRRKNRSIQVVVEKILNLCYSIALPAKPVKMRTPYVPAKFTL